VVRAEAGPVVCLGEAGSRRALGRTSTHQTYSILAAARAVHDWFGARLARLIHPLDYVFVKVSPFRDHCKRE
jgi:hypothetical protein